MNWLYYLLEANLYLVLFYGFYRLFLQNETFYNLNRYFLLIATVISFALPILQLGFLKPSFEKINGEVVYMGEIPPPPMEPPSAASLSNPFADVNWFYVVYLIIAFGFAVKLSFSIYKIIKIWLKAKKHTAGDITLVEVNGESTAFSFFNLLFIHPTLANQPAVLKHEMVHIKQRHSFDVVFFELVQIICWFNPILHFIKKDIKLLHEYIADELTTNADVQKHEYALFLIQNSFGLRAQPITNQIFNQSILKRRINMLNKKKTAAWARLRLLLVVPLTGSMLCMSTMAFTKDYGYVDLLPEKSEFVAPIQDKPKVENIKKNTAPKQDQVKFPPSFKPKNQNVYLPKFRTNPKTGYPVRLDNRYIILNGKPYDRQDHFYGIHNAEIVTILNAPDAIKKYGQKGAKGAVELIGSNMTFAFRPPIVKPDPPISKPKFQDMYFVRYSNGNDKNGNRVRLDKRYVIVNGKPLEDQEKFYGATNSESVTILNMEEAKKRYGSNGANGAVEITGSNIKYLDAIVMPTPPPIVDVVKFPPPVGKFEQKYFTPGIRTDKATGKRKVFDNRYIVVNGTAIEDNSKFYGVTQTKTVTYLSPEQAIKAYGEDKGKYGAVEIKGSNVYFNKEDDQIKFPPPIVRPDPPKKVKAPPPPIAPAAPKKKIDVKVPPPPVEPPPPPRKAKKVSAPPPPVDPEAKTINIKLKEENPTSLRLKKETD